MASRGAPTFDGERRPPWATGLGVAAALAFGVAALLAVGPSTAAFAGAVLIGAAVAGAAIYVAWHVGPAWTLTGALVLSAFNGNWDAFGLPGFVAPDRFLLIAGLAVLGLRRLATTERPTVRVRPVHWLLAAVLVLAIGSAVAAGTIAEYDTVLDLADRLAVPFAVFLLAPYAFRTAHERGVLLGGLVVLGGYLGLTSVFETVGPKSLVQPAFIADTSFGIHEGRARGPFLESAVNGFGLYVCAVAATIATVTWRTPRWRILASAVVALCGIAMLFTLTRSVWLAAVAATVVTLLAVSGLRRYVLPAVAAGFVTVLAAFALVPGFQDDATERSTADRPVWDRHNSNAAAISMIGSNPLLGIGYGTFTERSTDHLQLLDEVPQTNADLVLHNVFLSYGSELGLIGATLFVLALLVALGGAIVTRGPPELQPWRAGLLAIVIAWVVIANFVPFGHVFANLLPWLWAAVIVGGTMATKPATNGRAPAHLRGERAPARPPLVGLRRDRPHPA